MLVVVCNVCDRRIDPPTVQLKFEIPVFQHPERFTMEMIDLCMSCGLEFSTRFIALKHERHTIRK